MASIYSSMFPPAPNFTERSVGDLNGKVYIVTGASTGIGFELAKILYSKGATVYVGGRSESKISTAIANIQEAASSEHGQLKGFCLDLGDLTAVKPAVTRFLAAESRLDILVHNAGVMMPPPGSKTKLVCGNSIQEIPS
jgi:retinol dehydrogenase 12